MSEHKIRVDKNDVQHKVINKWHEEKRVCVRDVGTLTSCRKRSMMGGGKGKMAKRREGSCNGEKQDYLDKVDKKKVKKVKENKEENDNQPWKSGIG